MRPGIANRQLSSFDDDLRRSLGRITRSSISDFARSQAVLSLEKEVWALGKLYLLHHLLFSEAVTLIENWLTVY